MSYSVIRGRCMATKNEDSEPGHSFQQKVFCQQWKLEFLIGLVHTKNTQIYKFFSKKHYGNAHD